MNYVKNLSLYRQDKEECFNIFPITITYLYECFSLIRIKLERSGVVAGEVGDVLPARAGHHLAGGDHADGGGRHRALVQTDRWYGDARTEMLVLISLDTI